MMWERREGGPWWPWRRPHRGSAGARRALRPAGGHRAGGEKRETRGKRGRRREGKREGGRGGERGDRVVRERELVLAA
eukprot:3117672-Rhodomonas_salina.1